MKMRLLVAVGLLCVCFAGCSFAGGNTNRYNPHVQSRLPITAPPAEVAQSMEQLGGKNTTIQDEASHRKYWKEELYPIVFGDKKAPNTIMVLLDYAAPQSQRVWSDVVQAAARLDPHKVQVVVFGNSKEQYGTELMGYGIWVSIMRPKQAMSYYSYTLAQWNDVKSRQKAAKGKARPFQYEFDGTAGETERPFVYNFIDKLSPPLPEKQQPDVTKYAYDAGNINMFQAVEVAKYYGITSLPAIIVNDVVLKQVSVTAIVHAVQAQTTK
ncbi:MAG: hypothetical protein RRY29_06450 [Desulfovibrionaceae bacterium]